MPRRMRKSECEAPLKALAREWYYSLPEPRPDRPSFMAFVDWLRQTGQDRYLEFRSVTGSLYDAELWFDVALGQTWRR